jgi:hypothetical protein
MPRHRVINRRNTAPLERRTVSVSPAAIAAANDLAARLGVSLGSVIDTALRQLTDKAPAEVVDALAAHGHLTPDERRLVETNLTQEHP